MKELIKRPDEQREIDRLFIEMLDALGIPDTKWEDMVANQSLDNKWLLITQNRERMISGEVMAQSCVDFLHQVRQDSDIQISEIRELRTILGTSPKAFLEKFYLLDGFTEIKEVGAPHSRHP